VILNNKVRTLFKFLNNSLEKIESIVAFLIFKLNGAKIGKNIIIRGIPYVWNKGYLEIGDNVVINAKYLANPIGGSGVLSLLVKKGARLIIDDGVGISNSAIVCWNNIYIGKNVKIGGNCQIYDTDFHSLHLNERLLTPEPGIKTLPIRIGDGAFIGANVIILKGVIIGNESVIGAGAVVTENIPDFEVWAGNPATFIKKLK